MVAFSIDTGKIWWGKNGTWYSSGNPAADTNNITTITSSGAEYRPWAVLYGTTTDTSFNFGQRPFSYTPPTGFVALNTYNLPASTITNGAAYMAATTWTSVGGTETITNTVNGIGFQPDFVWMKNRTIAQNNYLIDSNRGSSKILVSNTTSAEVTDATFLTSFNSNGFSLGSGGFAASQAIVGWQWKAGTTSSSNTNGSITSTVSVGATQGFSVVTYTGTGSTATVGHGLGVAPNMVMVKSRSNNTGDGFVIYHKSLPSADYWLDLSTTGAQSGPSSAVWNGTAPTSTVFSIKTASGTNTNTYTYVAYCFSAVAGYSAFGSYTGNGSTDGTFVYTGFRPRFVMIKRTDSSPYNWVIGDTSRNTYNVATAQLSANLSDAENTSYMAIDFVSNGFKLRTTDGAYNASGGTYVYACWAENPFKFANAR
jgi:hypothetical protein